MYYLGLFHFTICLILSGLIWVIQIVHYPSFKYISIKNFDLFCEFHVRSISFIVFPLMFLELITAVLLLIFSPSSLTIINIIILGLIWLSTILLSVPIHRKLQSGYNIDSINKLIKTNWPRTIFWTFRSALLFSLILNYKDLLP